MKSPADGAADKNTPIFGELTIGSLKAIAKMLKFNKKDTIFAAGSGRGTPAFNWAFA